MTVPTLNEIKSKLEALPEERKKAARINSVRHYHKLVEAHADTLSRAVTSRRLVPQVFKGADLAKADEQIDKAGRAAARLHRSLTADMAKITADSVTKLMTTLGTHIEAAERACSTEWRRQVDAITGQYRQLVQALMELDRNIGSASHGIIERLVARQSTPPASDADAARLRADAAALAQSINNTGLQGEVGKFVTAALSRGADPRDLDKPAIRQFIEKHDHWDLFAIHFRSVVRAPG
jgi:hypothetical protein